MNCGGLIKRGIELPAGHFLAGMISNDQKIRQAGFTGLQSTPEMVRHWIGVMVAERIIPPAP